jgi:hypothetical protein
MTVKAFIYNDVLYIRVLPAKYMFKSTFIYEVVNRGDIFALNTQTQQLAIIPGKVDVEHLDIGIHKTIELPF